MHMPFMNGLEMAAKIRQLKICKKLKIVLITADEVRDKKHFDEIIEKPVPVIKLKEMYNE
jgi:two-component SAPR family response regulator